MWIRPLLTVMPVAVVFATTTPVSSPASSPEPRRPATDVAPADATDDAASRYAYALRNHSTAPDFILITVVDSPGKPGREVCLESSALIRALAADRGVGYDRALEIALASTDRTFHFTQPEARSEVQPRYTETDLTAARAAMKDLPLASLGSRDFIASLDDAGDARPKPARYAVAHVLLEKGFTCQRGCVAGNLIPGKLASRQAEDRRFEEEERQKREAAERVARALPGWDRVSESFKMTSVDVGFSNGEPESLCVELTPKVPGVVDSFDWWSPLEAGAPKHTWHDFLTYEARVQNVLRAHRWLAAFKAASSGRTVDVRLYGVGATSPSRALSNALELWKRAGLRGTPTAEVFARHGSRRVMLVLGSGESRLLAVSTTEPNESPQVALDRLNLTDKTGAEYAIIDPDGTITVR